MTKLLLFFHSRARFRIRMIIFLCIAFATATFAQNNVNIEGRVLDNQTHEPLPGVSVLALDTQQGTVSDANGVFTLQVQSFPLTIWLSYLGYNTEEVAIYEYSTEPVTLFLHENTNQLNEVVVIGYGTQKRQELTGAIASVPPLSIAQPALSFDHALGGAVAGLNVTQSSGQPGATSTVRIRGGNSITGGNEPLYVIDGFILYNDNSSTRTGAGQFDGGLNPLASLNTADIESIDVLKDVSATAIYGSRGANGVILITTKKGKKGRNIIQYQLTLGTQKATRTIDVLNAQQWADLYQELNNGVALSSEAINQAGSGANWQDAALQGGSQQTHQLSFSGGDEKSRYLLSGNYTDQDGVLLNTGLHRYAGRFNYDREVFRHLTVGVNVTASETSQNGLSNLSSQFSAGRVGGPLDYAIRISPLVPVYAGNNKANGFNYANPYESGDFKFGDFTINPVSDLVNTVTQTENTSFIGGFYAQYAILPYLTAKFNGGIHSSKTEQDFYAPSTSAPGLLVNGFGSIGNKAFKSWQTEFTLNFTKQFGIHALDALAGYTTQKTTSQFSVAGATNFANETLGFYGLSGGSNFLPPSSGGTESVLNSYLGRVNYSLLKRYNLTATLRADGSSRFASKHQWGYFPSVGLSWNINRESFFHSSVINDLKLRLTTGQVGNQEIGDYKYEATYATSLYALGGKLVTGYLRNNRENTDLKWETTTQHNAGLDVGLLKNRLNFVFDAYYKQTTDLLVEIPQEVTSGFTSGLRNVGNVSNKGVEAGLLATVFDRKDLQWVVSANIARNINEVVSLGSSVRGYSFYPSFTDYRPLSGIETPPLIVKEGEALGSFYGYTFNGVDPSTGKAVFGSQPEVLGSIQPDFTYGLSSSVTYKKVDVSFLFHGSQGNQLYNALRHNLETPTRIYNVSTVLLDRWTPSYASTDVPKAEAASNLQFIDSRYVEDASFLRLKHITVGYTLPLKIRRLPSAKARLSVTAQNLFTLTGYTGFDPEASRFGGDETNSLYQGIDLGAYPAARTFLFGLSLSL
ncbi:MAG: TonB-dependent receptor [Tannerella sp.]|nr:TonB-dependent receptor [Tannerella sp.]